MKIHLLTTDGSPLGVTLKDLWGEGNRGIGTGGSEYAMLTLCEEWHKAGHEIALYNNPMTPNGSPFEQRNISSFDPNEDRDVLVIFRSPSPRSLSAKGLKVWWSCDQETIGNFAHFAGTVHKIVCISPRHAQYFAERYKITNTTVIDIPVRMDDFDKFRSIDKIKNRLIFTSVPGRGLDNLLRTYPLIQQTIPDVSLAITSDYRLWGVGASNEQFVYRWSGKPNVNYFGALPRIRYIEELMKAQILLYQSGYDELFCVYGNMVLRTVGGTKLIKDIQIGDFVLDGHSRFSRVYDKYSWIDKHIKYSISTFGHQLPLEVTEGHKVLAIKKRTCPHEPLNKKYKIKAEMCIARWEKVEDLSVGDILLSSFPTDIIDKQSLFISSYVKNTEVFGDKLYQKHKHESWGTTLKKCNIPDEILINLDFMRLLGYYISEGSTGKGSIQFALHKEELSTLGNEIKQALANLFGLTTNESIRGNSLQIWTSSTPLARFFELLCGHGAKNKHIPEWAMILPLDKQLLLLMCLIKGDGHIEIPKTEKNTVAISYSTISLALAYQVRDLFSRFGICSSVNKRKGFNSYNIVCSGEQLIPILKEFGIDWISTRKSSHRYWMHDGFIHMPITKITKEDSWDVVYDISIENGDHSFVANGRVVHNCVSVAEAQYAGAYPITSATGALPTTNMGTVINVDADNPRGDREFADATISLLQDTQRLEQSQLGVYLLAEERFNPKRILGEWDKLFGG